MSEADPNPRPTIAPEPVEPRSGDLTQGPLVRTLAGFAVPQMVGNVLQTLNGTINAIWVSRLIGPRALAATATANILMFLIFGVVFGVGMAGTVQIARAYGARDLAAARSSFGNLLGVVAIIGVTVSALGWIFAPELLHWLSAPPAARDLALAYLRVIFVSTPATMLTLTCAMGLRGTGDARTPLRVLVLTSLLDVSLNPLLIRGFGPVPALGIAGSALATALATAVGLGIMVALIYTRDLPLRLRGAELAYLRPRAGEVRYLLTKGLPMGAQMLVISGAAVVFIGLVNREGLTTAAAYGALLQLWNYIAMPAMAIGAAVSAMVAQHIGAGLARRTDAISAAGAGVNLVITGALIGVLMVFDEPALAVFLGYGSPTLAVALHIQNWVIWSYLPFGITIVLFGALRAFGVVWAQLVVLVTSMLGLRYGAYWLLYPRFGADALWYSMLISSLASMAMVLAVYALGGWRRRLAPAP